MRASRPTAVRVVAASRLAAGPPLVVGEGFIPPADTCGSAGSPGRCKHRPLQRFAIPQRVRLPGWPQALPFRRGGFHIRPRVFAPPRFPGWSLCFPPSCRAGVHARRTFLCLQFKIRVLFCREARRDEGIPPYGRPGGCGFPVGRRPTVGRRGGIYPSRGHLRRRGAPGTMQASSPTEVCGLRRRAFKSWLTHLFKNAPAFAGAILLVGQPGTTPPTP